MDAKTNVFGPFSDRFPARRSRISSAEIEGLKARVEALRQIIEEDKALIAELCDALASYQDLHWQDLLQRAREATR